jgi:hypothetical protein
LYHLDVSRNASTLVICFACGGDYQKADIQPGKYRMSVCRWCTNGGMDREQVKAWTEHVEERKKKES